jgi:acetaldehyde dehydrogenase (acetylating)
MAGLIVASGVTTKVDRLKEVLAGLQSLSDHRVMVGIPEDRDGRKKTADSPIGNAALGYIHEHGAPEVNLPARPWLEPPVKESGKDVISPGLKRAAQLALEGKSEGVMRVYNAMGLKVVNAVRAYISAGIAPPLSQRTIDARRRRSKGSKYRRKATTAVDVTPLVDTGQFRNAITYVIKSLRGNK